jgi:hypothetical protein
MFAARAAQRAPNPTLAGDVSTSFVTRDTLVRLHASLPWASRATSRDCF